MDELIEFLDDIIHGPTAGWSVVEYEKWLRQRAKEIKKGITGITKDEASEDKELDEMITLNTMLFVGGSKALYRCSCGANVFSKRHDERGDYYECHGCHEIYREAE